jgi:hypothetical protein
VRKNWQKQIIATVAKRSDWSRVFENKAIRTIYRHKNGKDFVPAAHDLTPETLRELAKKYTMADLLEAIKDNRLFSHHERLWRDQLVKAGLTRLDDIRLPRSTITLELLQSLPKNKLLALQADILPLVQGYNWYHHVREYVDRHREPTVKDIIDSEKVLRAFGPTTITRIAIMFKNLGFTSKNCSFIRQAMKKSHRIRISERGGRLFELSQVEFD